MPTPDLAVQRLRAQHLLRPDFASAADAVRWFGAVQAQDYLGALYAVGLRVRNATEGMVEGAIARGQLIRTWPMRGTIHFVPPEDARWMLELLAPRAISRSQAYYRRVGLNDEAFTAGRKVIVRALKGGKQLTRPELYRVLEGAGIPTGPEQRGLFILGYWAQRGLICFGPHRGRQPTFTLLDEWVPPGRDLRGDEALAELAARYFVSHGPATLKDFAWWTGLPQFEARRGLQAARSQLVEQVIGGRSYWSGSWPTGKGKPAAEVLLLPPYDEFGVAYADRSALVDPDVSGQVAYGLGPNIIVKGRLAGTWKRARDREAVSVQFTFLQGPSAGLRAAAQKAAQRYAGFVGLRLAS